MKAIQIMLDEETLRLLDTDDEVKKKGRSAVLRRAAAEYLKRKERTRIAAQYKQAYGTTDGLGDEFSGWEDEGSWPNT